jgi:hypothetical protein
VNGKLIREIAAEHDLNSLRQKTPAALPPDLQAHETAKLWLSRYPGADKIPNRIDDKIISKCLGIAHGDPEQLAVALKSMSASGKKPNDSWAWFATVLPSYVPESATPRKEI